MKREVNRIKALNENVITAWTTAYIGTADNRGFQCSGNYTCTFKNGKISNVRIVISPKADVAPNLTLEGLAVDDIGRLALAAWTVV